MITRIAIVLVLCLSSIAFANSETSWGRQSSWKGFQRFDFTVDTKPCYIVVPKQVAEGKPWVWRARFPNYHPEIDIELLKRGYHIAHMNTNGMLGSDKALDYWDQFYDHMTGKGLAKKPALEAVSRGGLFVYRWTARHPKRVACIYADTPVLDFKSWPGGKGRGVGHAGTWKQVLQHYGLTEAQAMMYRKNPIDLVKPIAAAKVPILHIVTENDRIVPPAENTMVFFKRYNGLNGARMEVIRVKAGTAKSNGHHFTLTKDHIDKAVKFIVQHTK